MEKKITIGSRAFFNGMPDFRPKDTDTLVLTDNPKGFTNYRQSSMSGRCVMEWVVKPKADFIAYALREKAGGLEFGKFIVPEVIEELGLTLDDLKTLYAHYKDRLDAQHDYQRIICKAYMDNGGFTLTDAQREEAYKSYQEARKVEQNKTK